MNPEPSTASPRFRGAEFALALILLATALSLLLHGAWNPDKIFFSNDWPLGALMAQCHQPAEKFAGCWQDLNAIGYREWIPAPSITLALEWLLKSVWFSRLYPLAALLILGLGAWAFFQQSGLAPVACVLGGMAAMLSSSFFSASCWGVATFPITVGMSFFALAALAGENSRLYPLRLVLAGLAVGMAVTEGADIGALFSLLVAALLMFQACVSEAPPMRNFLRGLGRLALVAACAALVAAQTIAVLVATNIKGVAGTQQDSQTRQQRWDWATQWSFPKKETLGLVVPGLFGFRMDTPNGGAYWGSVGRDPAWDRYLESGAHGPPPDGYKRFSGGGSYLGVPVVFLALWAAAQSLRRGNSPFGLSQRKWLWFWLVVGGLSLFLAFGRFAAFYRLLYSLPYVSTVRNPVKFLHVFCVATIVLFAYAIDALWTKYLHPVPPANPMDKSQVRRWWTAANIFDRYWIGGMFLLLAASSLAWFLYASARPSLEHHLQTIQVDPALIAATAAFSIRQVGWFILALGLTTLFMAGTLGRAFAGKPARWAVLFLGLILFADLGHANQPWIIYWNYRHKYAGNPIIDKLRANPCEHRVAVLPFAPPPEFALLGQLYQGEWLRHLFPSYNIQSLDVVQLPRVPIDFVAFQQALSPSSDQDAARLLLRYWQLTNTRYVLAAAGPLNQEIDPGLRRFHVTDRFAIKPKPGVSQQPRLEDLTAIPAPDGPFALFEFTGALARARLYTRWLVFTNDAAALARLASPAFDPAQTVLVAQQLPSPSLSPSAPSVQPITNNGSVVFTSYAPKEIVLQCEAVAPSVLLLNDHFDPNWQVSIDGKPDRLLRCNYLMRGVYLPPGAHTVQFRFRPPLGPLYLSLAAISLGLFVLGFVMIQGLRSSRESAPHGAQ